MANAVGMAMAEAHLANKFNKPGFPIVDHYTYVIAGDGCMMEGISSEAASLAGSLGLGKLIVLYDSNNITIEGSTDIAFREDVVKRFEAYGWHVQHVKDGNDLAQISAAITAATEVLFGYTPVAGSYEAVKSGASAELTGALRIVSDNAAGGDRDWYLPKVTLTPNGDLPLIAEGTDVVAMEFGLEALKPANGEAIYCNGRPVAP